eukprot:2639236-Amphidinium_carterae.1
MSRRTEQEPGASNRTYRHDDQARKFTDYRGSSTATSGLGSSPTKSPTAAECLPAAELQETSTATGIMPRTRRSDNQ